MFCLGLFFLCVCRRSLVERVVGKDVVNQLLQFTAKKRYICLFTQYNSALRIVPEDFSEQNKTYKKFCLLGVVVSQFLLNFAEITFMPIIHD